MLEEGVVANIKDNGKAAVEFQRTSSCGTCCACSVGAGGKMNIEADNQVGAEPGDKVRLNIETKGVALGIIMVYLLPALGLIFGVIFGSKVSPRIGLTIDPENFGIFFGIALMLLFFAAARYYGRKMVSYSAEIVEVIKE